MALNKRGGPGRMHVVAKRMHPAILVGAGALQSDRRILIFITLTQVIMAM